MRVLITGNREKDLCAALVPLLEAAGHPCTCVSRANGYDFEDGQDTVHRVALLADDHDVFINMYANHFFQASVLAYKVFNRWVENKAEGRRMINIGSTTDRVKKGKNKLYHYEKIALRELSSGLSLIGVWENAPRVSHISFGTLTNKAKSNPGRACLEMKAAADYIMWILSQPAGIHINELSVDPIQPPR
jgi:hypothetical protein